MTPSPNENRPQGWEATGAGPGDEPTGVKNPSSICGALRSVRQRESSKAGTPKYTCLAMVDCRAIVAGK